MENSQASAAEPEAASGQGGFAVIWNMADVPRLKIRRCPDGHGFEIANQPKAIQFLRCHVWDGTVLTAGRITVAWRWSQSHSLRYTSCESRLAYCQDLAAERGWRIERDQASHRLQP